MIDAMELLYYKFLSLFQKARVPYVLVGGKKGLTKLVNDFYNIMESSPEALAARRLHPTDLTHARQKLYMFLSGWFGGPNLYWQAYGHPRMRARHMKFPIGPTERDQWIWCMEQALVKQPWRDEFKEYSMKSFRDFAHHMQNRNDQ